MEHNLRLYYQHAPYSLHSPTISLTAGFSYGAPGVEFMGLHDENAAVTQVHFLPFQVSKPWRRGCIAFESCPPNSSRNVTLIHPAAVLLHPHPPTPPPTCVQSQGAVKMAARSMQREGKKLEKIDHVDISLKIMKVFESQCDFCSGFLHLGKTICGPGHKCKTIEFFIYIKSCTFTFTYFTAAQK